MKPLLSVQGLVKRYGALLVTDAVDLDIRAGEVHAVIGPNGAGKTTLINQIAGEVRSDAGRIWLDGQDVTPWSVAARAQAGLGRSYQITSVIAEFSVLENVLLAVQAVRGHNFRFWQPVTRTAGLVEAADRYLSLVGLSGVRRRTAGLLSYGQQRQLELAMTLAIEPEVLLLDEPMAGLGPTETQQMVEVLQGLRARYAMLLVEHDMQAVFALADRMSVLVYGKVVFCGSPAEVRESAIVREAYLGDEEIPA
ncbi:ABC transporter ATP-binding protein [Variovorax sp. J22P271]|uniref:ABC transporter ATP-binding protein n=1 Tax=Variovorax davisae TaxID=3053515 RepID=UPI002576FC66|nr:ABC transporter ATP-binding protein [Variovorax sp. J22P271]MDM0033782.1 ABC transporter ATP-binding protein [Variovorax sp. J22P271]